MYLEKYKDIFGKPNEGPHSYRIPCLDLAAVDVIGTIIISIMLYILIGSTASLSIITLIMFSSGIVLHRIFGVKTKLDRVIFGDF